MTITPGGVKSGTRPPDFIGAERLLSEGEEVRDRVRGFVDREVDLYGVVKPWVHPV